MNELNNLSIISIDAETNGLWGQAFAIAGVVYNKDGTEKERFIGRCPIEEELNEWVRDNVINNMSDIEENYADYKSMLKAFFDFLAKYKKSKVLVHMGHIVESKLLLDAHKLGIIGDWDATYEWFDVCILFGDSVDTYNTNHNIRIENCIGDTHNPLYDCISAYRAFKHFVSE